MLKRQRQVSPPAEAPTISSTPPSMDIDHFMHSRKRRRTVAPELDGRVRGAMSMEEEVVEDDDDEISTSDESEGKPHEGNERDREWQEQTGEYTRANSLLHQLHFEQQKRFVHPPRPYSQSNTSVSSTTSNYPFSSSPSSMALSYPLRTEPPSPIRAHVLHRPLEQHKDTRMYLPQCQINEDRMELEEFKCVRARYEGHNRCYLPQTLPPLIEV